VITQFRSWHTKNFRCLPESPKTSDVFDEFRSFPIFTDFSWSLPKSNRLLLPLQCSIGITTIGQRHAKRDLLTYAKSVDPDQPPLLRRSVWSGSALVLHLSHQKHLFFLLCKTFDHVSGLLTAFVGWSWSTLFFMPEDPLSRDACIMISNSTGFK